MVLRTRPVYLVDFEVFRAPDRWGPCLTRALLWCTTRRETAVAPHALGVRVPVRLVCIQVCVVASWTGVAGVGFTTLQLQHKWPACQALLTLPLLARRGHSWIATYARFMAGSRACGVGGGGVGHWRPRNRAQGCKAQGTGPARAGRPGPKRTKWLPQHSHTGL